MPKQGKTGITRRLYVLFQYPKLSETFVRNEIKALRELGADIDVISVEPGDANHIEPNWAGQYRLLSRPSRSRAVLDHLWFAVHHHRSYLRYLIAVVRLREYWRIALQRLPTEARNLRARELPRGCHTHFAWDTAAITAYISRLLDVPASVTLHANDIYVADPARLRARLAHFDQLATVCNFNAGLLRGLRVAGVGSKTIDIVPCGVAVPEAPTSASSAQRVDVVSVGRLVEKKGFDTSCEHWRRCGNASLMSAPQSQAKDLNGPLSRG